jgi:hypothetical protein
VMHINDQHGRALALSLRFNTRLTMLNLIS